MTAVAALTIAWMQDSEVRSEILPARHEAFETVPRGALYFHGDDFGGLSRGALDTHAVPWRLAAAAFVLAERDRDPGTLVTVATLHRVLARFGFLFPARIGNWPLQRPQPPASTDYPLGMTHGRLAVLPGLRVTVANLGCASCHAGVRYDSSGRPQPAQAWLGSPNTSLDLEAYTTALYDALEKTADRPEALLDVAGTLFPEMDARERFALRRLVLPRVQARLDSLRSLGRPTPFPNGSPGTTNGVAALKRAVGVALADHGRGEIGTTSVPDLGHRTWRSSLLYDGSYAVPGRPRNRPMTRQDVTQDHVEALAAIMTFFTVPSMGVAPGDGLSKLDRAEAVMRFLDAYRAPPFPGKIDAAAARRGSVIYAARCAACHGRYSDDADAPRLLAFPNWIGSVGTDPARARLFGKPLADAVNRGPYRARIAAAATGAYAAPPLDGLWTTAPYLHNGSVPTIAALLDPTHRPGRFLVGGHKLDFDRVGIALTADGAYPAGYRPWSRPVWIDVQQPGRGNGGHEHGRELSAAERAALIEFLKRL
ncbi:hypothetical protein [Sphingosinicella sp. BN140058]|uniref:c-type cytochrome n=1 Tax=Sphingosinicella sp. BN140058 TaxID=1892855 RepID=UPI0010105A4E|nr:hypothetical protein [Sphingosinicella sp. BN140058]QAY78369.1 hypothetical protein ETR14_18885 [Sphingosinicella sp. BN140058]